jgi:hypothetical protein
MKSFKYLYILLLPISMALNSCEKDPQIPNEEELITTVTYTLTPVSGGDPVIFSFRDLDGDGGQSPVVVLGRPKANTVYNAMVALYNESVSPVDTITIEVSEEALEHQFFYTFSDLNASYIYTDLDAENHPVGIMTRVNTGEPSEGLVTIILRHLPDKYAAGVSEGDISNAGGETDIEVSFQVIIE